MGNERMKTKAADNAREELGEERAKTVEDWMKGVEDDSMTEKQGSFYHGAFFLLFDWLRLRGVAKEQAARTSELLVNHRAGRDTP